MAFEIFDTVTSTMDVARENITSGRLRFDAPGRLRYDGVLAREQTAGRGQRGRSWYAPPGAALCATYYFGHGRLDPENAGHAAFIAGVAAIRAIENTVAETNSRTALPDDAASAAGLGLGLKWPNDLLLGGRKLGGILIEMVKCPDEGWVALIGMGVNVNVREFPPELEPFAASLLRSGHGPYDPVKLAEAILAELGRAEQQYLHEGFQGILDAWRRFDRTPGRRYEAMIAGGMYYGAAEGIDEAGALLLRLEDGRLMPVTSASSLRETSAQDA